VKDAGEMAGCSRDWSYRGDVEGWRAYVDASERRQRSPVARIDGDDLLPDHGRRHRLEDCDRVRV
jgi:hypothetical protein